MRNVAFIQERDTKTPPNVVQLPMACKLRHNITHVTLLSGLRRIRLVYVAFITYNILSTECQSPCALYIPISRDESLAYSPPSSNPYHNDNGKTDQEQWSKTSSVGSTYTTVSFHINISEHSFHEELLGVFWEFWPDLCSTLVRVKGTLFK